MQEEDGEDSPLFRAPEVNGVLTVSDLERPKDSEVECQAATVPRYTARLKLPRALVSPLSASCRPLVGAGGQGRAMDHVTFTKRLRGHTTVVGPGVVDAQLSTRGTRVATRLVFSDEATFREEGTIDFGSGNALRFRSLENGRLEPAPDGSVRHGTSVLEVDGGDGRYAGARGRITSNFVLSPNGEITDEQVAVLFIGGEERS